GAGAVGGAIAARLSLAGRDVVAIARGEHLRAMRRGGLRLVTPDADELVRLDAVEDPSAARIASDDVVLLCVKSHDTAAALTALAAVAPPDVAVVCAQNGVDNERQALRHFEHVYGVVVFL